MSATMASRIAGSILKRSEKGGRRLGRGDLARFVLPELGFDEGGLASEHGPEGERRLCYRRGIETALASFAHGHD